MWGTYAADDYSPFAECDAFDGVRPETNSISLLFIWILRTNCQIYRAKNVSGVTPSKVFGTPGLKILPKFLNQFGLQNDNLIAKTARVGVFLEMKHEAADA